MLILFGSTGYLGTFINQYFSQRGFEVKTPRVDVTDRASVQKVLEGIQDAIVINATGKTGSPNVDWCEDHRLETVKVNVIGAINVAEVASKQGNFVIQLGSGCIFEGDEKYAFTEEDTPNFFGSFYSQTKAIAEGALKEIPNVSILRIRMPLSSKPHPKNLLTKLLNYEKILNVPNSVTVLEDFMPFLERVIEKRPEGVLNAVNPGVYYHKDLLELYQKKIDPNHHIQYIGLREFEGMTKAKRSNCVLSTKRQEVLGITMPEVHESLQRLVEIYRTSIINPLKVDER